MPSASAGVALPTTIRVVGRVANQENADICGEYLQRGEMHGRPVYCQANRPTVLRYSPNHRRWVIGREGFCDSEVCVAYAADNGALAHPGHAELIWRVWSSYSQTFETDTQVISVAAPRTVSFLGRAQGREHEKLNGSYELFAVCHGRPAYKHSSGDYVIKYQKDGQRWMITPLNEAGSMCYAFAADNGLEENPNVELIWSFYESQMGAFFPDPDARMLVAPTQLQVIGRSDQLENARLNGRYLLAGVAEGKPVYVKPGACTLIRYSAHSGQGIWLIDPDGLAEPSIAAKLYYWIARGDAGAASDRCIAFAPAGDTDHPGLAMLEWHVWESSRGAHVLDSSVRSTIAPDSLQVFGRAEGRENSLINGVYELVGSHCGRPAYIKPGTQVALRFWPPRSRWLIDTEGLRNTDACSAFMESHPYSEHPADTCSSWRVYESARGCHLEDACIGVAVCTRRGGIEASEANQGIASHQQQLQQQLLLQHQYEQACSKDAMLAAQSANGVRLQQNFFGA
mmetsp:Transcript_73715/g.130142  ORF Transcript_73715/g.130142 Transcript_73715/m.130142 type:complete len:512 (+) Transcript_73715:58-1593(+)